MMLLLALSLFFSDPAPLEMPQAEAYLVNKDGERFFEDRFHRLDLWMSRTVDGRWTDDDGRIFAVATLSTVPPDDFAEKTTTTRSNYVASVKSMSPKDELDLHRAISLISPIEIAEKPWRPRQRPRGFKEVDYWQGTNRNAIVCTCFPEKDGDRARSWQLYVWVLAEGDDYDEALGVFEREFLFKVNGFECPPALERIGKIDLSSPTTEREHLRREARHAISAYDGWHAADSDEFTVLDDLPGERNFISSLTNELKAMRAKYAEVVPTGINGSNVLAVARIFASKGEYLDALAMGGHANMEWSAAYWSQSRRELVAHLPSDGTEQLMKTIRHEAFHQYLSYAASMITVSPWLNEGYAQYFEGNELKLGLTAEDGLKNAAEYLPKLMRMDYEEFYSDSSCLRMFNYQLAHSIAVFLEKGAPNVRFRPFAKVKQSYFSSLFETHDMLRATEAAFPSEEQEKLFAAEWIRFYRENASAYGIVR